VGSYRKSSQGIDAWLFLGHLCSVGVEFNSWLGTQNYSRAIPGQWRWSIRLSQRVVLDWLTTGSCCWGLPSGWLVVGSLAWWWPLRVLYSIYVLRGFAIATPIQNVSPCSYIIISFAHLLTHIWVRSLISCCVAGTSWLKWTENSFLSCNKYKIFLLVAPLSNRSWREQQTNVRINVNGGHVQQCNQGYTHSKHEPMVAPFMHCFVPPPRQLRVNSLPTAATWW